LGLVPGAAFVVLGGVTYLPAAKSDYSTGAATLKPL